MTALDYLRSKARNVNLGHKDSTRKWDPYITVTLADGAQYPYRGLVDFADPQVDPQTGTFSVRAEMPNPDHVLLPGQSTKVLLLLDVRENAVTVPMKAVIIEKGGAYIYVARENGTAEKRFIELGPQQENLVVVERGLAAGEEIVVEGYHKLLPGMVCEAYVGDNLSATAVALPANVILIDTDNRTFVWTAVGGKAHKTYVEVGESVGSRVVINSGISAGDKVIVSGQQKVSEGTKIAEL